MRVAPQRILSPPRLPFRHRPVVNHGASKFLPLAEHIGEHVRDEFGIEAPPRQCGSQSPCDTRRRELGVE